MFVLKLKKSSVLKIHKLRNGDMFKMVHVMIIGLQWASEENVGFCSKQADDILKTLKS